MQSIKEVAVTAVVGCLLLGCGGEDLRKDNELVMCEGMAISVHAPDPITITAINKIKRKYVTNDIGVTVNLIPREVRWYTSFGLYKPSGTRNLHMVLEEGQQHFYSEEEALHWLAIGAKKPESNLRYTSDGLVVAWENPEGILLADVWQIYIQGKKPRALFGSSDSVITVSVPSEKSDSCVTVGEFTPSAPENIAGRLFSGRAIDLMREQGVTAADVIGVIENGRGWKSGDYVIYLSKGTAKPSVVVLDSKGVVITIV
jgi:hypothetical protein